MSTYWLNDFQVKANERFAYTWKGGHEDNVGYGVPLDTVVTWTLSRVGDGTLVRSWAGFRVKWSLP